MEVAGALEEEAPAATGNMKTHEFLSQLDEAGIVAEIAKAESRTTGEIRVFVSRRTVNDPVPRAQERFEKLGMTRTQSRNGVLLYFAPRSHKFAVVGDTAIHEKCGPEFWTEVISEIRPHLQAKNFTAAVTHAIRKVGEMLARHFPQEGGDRDELSNEIAAD